MSTENEQLIELITAQTKNLLQTHWTDIDSCRDGEDDIRIGFSHKLSYEGTERTIKTTIRFAHQVSDEVEETFDTAQEELPMKVTIEKPKRK